METLRKFLDVFLHLDKHLDEWAQLMGSGLYGVLFLIIFCETGLVVTPFLPGDSLLFAVGALGKTEAFSLPVVMVVMFVAAVLGDAVNYSIGYRIGPKAFTRDDSMFLKKKHLFKAQAFYEKHGGKAIILARFVPIVRTFAPFVAGIGKMSYQRFLAFNVIGAGVWVVLLTLAGVQFAEVPFVKKHFELVVLAIVGLSVLPIVIEYVRDRMRGGDAKPAANAD